MKQVADNDEFLFRYLLGELSEEEQEAVEERYIADQEFYEKLLAAEDDLIDAFARNELSESRRRSFENWFLRIPDRRQRVEFASDLRTYVTRQSVAPPTRPEPAPRPRLLAFLGLNYPMAPMALRAAAVILGMVAVGWLGTETIRLNRRLNQAESQRAELENRQRESDKRADDERRRREDLEAQLEEERLAHVQPPDTEVPTERTPSAIVSAILFPGALRGSGAAKRIVIEPTTRKVRLEAAFEQGDDYKSYRAVIRTVEGQPVWSQSALKARTTPRGKSVVMLVPATKFNSADYTLTLTGLADTGQFEGAGEYAFTAVKK